MIVFVFCVLCVCRAFSLGAALFPAVEPSCDYDITWLRRYEMFGIVEGGTSTGVVQAMLSHMDSPLQTLASTASPLEQQGDCTVMQNYLDSESTTSEFGAGLG